MRGTEEEIQQCAEGHDGRPRCLWWRPAAAWMSAPVLLQLRMKHVERNHKDTQTKCAIWSERQHFLNVDAADFSHPCLRKARVLQANGKTEASRTLGQVLGRLVTHAAMVKQQMHRSSASKVSKNCSHTAEICRSKSHWHDGEVFAIGFDNLFLDMLVGVDPCHQQDHSEDRKKKNYTQATEDVTPMKQLWQFGKMSSFRTKHKSHKMRTCRGWFAFRPGIDNRPSVRGIKNYTTETT